MTQSRKGLAGVNVSEIAGRTDEAVVVEEKPVNTPLDSVSKERLSEQVDGLIEADLKICFMWEHGDRTDDISLSKESIKQLAKSIKAQGQIVPAIARRIKDGKNTRYEIIAGRRRFEACKYLERRLLIRVRPLSDKEAFAVMLIENDSREDITKMSRAISFHQAIQSKIYASYEDLIDFYEREQGAKRYSKGEISKMVSAAKLQDYEFIWDKIKNPASLNVKPVYALVSALKGDSESDISRRLAELANAGELEGMDGNMLVALLNKVCEKAGKPAKKAKSSFSAGKCKMTAAFESRKTTLTFNKKLTSADRESLITLIESLVETL